MMELKLTDAQRLRAAAQILEHGWIQGRLGDGHGNYCMLGALRIVDGSADMPLVPPALVDVIQPSYRFLPRRLRLSNSTRNVVATYNDYKERTKCEVLNTMCRAAKLAEERGE